MKCVGMRALENESIGFMTLLFHQVLKLERQVSNVRAESAGVPMGLL